MLALPAMALYVIEKTARLGSEPGRRKERARSVCVQSVREGSTTARNLWAQSQYLLHGASFTRLRTYLICFCSTDSAMFPVRSRPGK